MAEEPNPLFDLAVSYVLSTRRHIFLTGKAGTGKTTFLRRLQTLEPKPLVVVAPTGVAAINAGGVTIHSFSNCRWAPSFPKVCGPRSGTAPTTTEATSSGTCA
ncbi:MAG: AAA family ATPase [Cytophagales bacterium]|nr:AAA family ATPase [Cytophagales bacterium]